MLQTFDSNSIHDREVGVSCLFVQRDLPPGISGVYSPTANKKTTKKNRKLINNMFFLGGWEAGQKS